ncbi:MAG TPA: VWA domain-containing protein [Pyrinomonadaceae bacterium]|nr:VWA domain-containing protein [Pyrinomonadaceae bacterium]
MKVFQPSILKLASALALLLSCYLFAAAQTPQTQTPAATVAESDKARVPVKLSAVVLDEAGNFVEGLRIEDFQLTEDGVAQTLTSFARKDLPLSYAVLVDNSGSLRTMIDPMIRMGESLVESNNAQDETMIVRFVGRENIETLREFTSNKNALRSAFEEMYVEGGLTALVEALYLAAREVAARRPDEARHRALVVITDGEDRGSFYKPDYLLNYLRQHQIQVFAIGLTDAVGGDAFSKSDGGRDKARKLLNTLAAETGGHALFPKKVANFQEAIGALSRHLHMPQYTFAYASGDAAAKDKTRKVEIKFADPASAERKRWRIISGS